MRPTATASAVVALVASGLLAACGGGSDDTREGPLSAVAPSAPSPDLMVRLRRSEDLAGLLQRHGLGLQSQFGQRPIYRLRGDQGSDAAALVESLRADAAVLAAELNQESQAPEARHNSVWAVHNSVWAVGTDSRSWVGQWAAQSLRLPEAHAVSQGAGVRIAFLDTGADLSHPQLMQRWARTRGGAVLGRDFVDNDANPTEVTGGVGYGHGTHVAGLLALAAPAAQLMPLRVLDRQGRGNAWVLAEAMAWALDPDGNPATDDGAHVINLSLGTWQPTTLMRDVVRLAACDFDYEDDDDDDDGFAGPGYAADRTRCRAGHAATVVAAAGNDASDNQMVYPAAESDKGLLPMAAYGAHHRMAPFSNWGGWIKMAAPGEAVISTVPGGWGVWSGTSMSTPLASGLAALLIATYPESADSSRPPQRQWTAEDVIKRITDGAGGLCNSSIKGLDAAAAMNRTSGQDRGC